MQIRKDPVSKFDYVFDFNYNEEIIAFCRHIKSIKGMNSLKFVEKKWRFNDLHIMHLLLEKYFEIEVHANMQEDIELFELEKKQKEIQIMKGKELKKSMNSNVQINNIKGTLYGFQKATVAWLLNNNGRGLVSLDMGLGKTFVSLAYVAHTKKEKTLIVVPASMKYSWADEVSKWTKLKALVINSKSELGLKEYNDHDIIILNYDILKKFFVFLTSVKFDCLVVDESTYIKNPNSIRSKILKKISQRIESVILLSGSPILNRTIELYTSLNVLDQNTWNDYYGFARRYCAAYQSRWGLDVSGSSNIPELKERIDEHIIRKRKEDVLKDLPEKKFIDIPIQLENGVQGKYQLLENSLRSYLKETKNKTRAEIQKSLLAETLVKLNELRQLTSEGKIEATKELIQDVLSSGEKVIVFSSFNAPLNMFKKHFKKEAVMIVGSTSDIERKNAIDEFQSNSKIKVFLGGINSASMGITLTAASNVIFLDLDWTPENMRQGYSRCDRIGQKADSISIYQMIALKTIDQKMLKILKEKQGIIDKLIDGKEMVTKQKQGTIFKDVINSYE